MKNVAASVRARLLNLSRATGEPFAAVLDHYVTGRFLARLEHADSDTHFVLKGAQLFRLWGGELHRPTKDLDLLGFGDPSEERLQEEFELVCATEMPIEDGLEWGAVRVSEIREDQDYGGIRAVIDVALAGAKTRLQIDVGFGDSINPAAQDAEWKGVLDFPSATILAYPPETVVAEKLEAAVHLGIANSRMKDFFDLHWMGQNLAFEAPVLRHAIEATFQRRGTPFPAVAPLALTEEFAQDEQKQAQWEAFRKRLQIEASSLDALIASIAEFLLPVILSKIADQRRWVGGRWE